MILYSDHRESRHHDHVVSDLADRFEMVLEAVEKDDGWATNRVTPGKVILGDLDGIEAGVRQMIRTVPLEVPSARRRIARRPGRRVAAGGDPDRAGARRAHALAAAGRGDPGGSLGQVARAVEQVLTYSRPYGSRR